MSGCVVLVMSSCHDKDTGGYDVLVYVKLSWQKNKQKKNWQVMMYWLMSRCH